jgi:hypothetical protein
MITRLGTCYAESGTQIKMKRCARHAAAYLHVSHHGSTDEAVADSHLRQHSGRQPSRKCVPSLLMLPQPYPSGLMLDLTPHS